MTIELHEPAALGPGRIADDGAAAPDRDRGISVVERVAEPRRALRIDRRDIGAPEPAAQAGERGMVHGRMIQSRA